MSDIKPSSEILSAVISQSIEPIMRDIEKDLGRSLPVTVTVFRDHLIGPRVRLTRDAEDASEGEIRLRFRRVFGDRIVFSAQAVFERTVSPDTGLSGFDLRGELDQVDGAYAVRTKNHTIRYNVWEWS